jgi:pimeloyl-ACP methyl ester carboxylesterase
MNSPVVQASVVGRASRSEFHEVRGVRLHVRRWAKPEAPLLLMLHGWMDSSATFQFVVDAFAAEWNVVAPDWAGYGLSGRRCGDYLATSYIADLDALLGIFSPSSPALIVAHSMAGQVSTLYCGARPHRVAALVNLDGLAPLPPFGGEAEIDRLAMWLDYAAQTRQPRTFDSTAAFAAELVARNPRLNPDRAEFLARHFSRESPDGRVELLADPRHYRVGSMPRFSPDTIEAALHRFAGRVLWIRGGRSHLSRVFERHPQGPETLARRFASARNGSQVLLPHAGHNVQHDEPERVAHFVERFMLPHVELGT